MRSQERLGIGRVIFIHLHVAHALAYNARRLANPSYQALSRDPRARQRALFGPCDCNRLQRMEVIGHATMKPRGQSDVSGCKDAALQEPHPHARRSSYPTDSHRGPEGEHRS